MGSNCQLLSCIVGNVGISFLRKSGSAKGWKISGKLKETFRKVGKFHQNLLHFMLSTASNVWYLKHNSLVVQEDYANIYFPQHSHNINLPLFSLLYNICLAKLVPFKGCRIRY